MSGDLTVNTSGRRTYITESHFQYGRNSRGVAVRQNAAQSSPQLFHVYVDMEFVLAVAGDSQFGRRFIGEPENHLSTSYGSTLDTSVNDTSGLIHHTYLAPYRLAAAAVKQREHRFGPGKFPSVCMRISPFPFPPSNDQ
ncbi:hypothetical protein [Streptomyces ardesiacus]|uniref:hypothetical protein n=1 Tax=Streptomyces ardesiacus TaxID=285564 RepID=UPI00131E0E61|nr:hypothetical protein [Streptomyces sp. NBRC 110030]